MSIKKLLVAAAVIAGSSSAALAHPYRQQTYRHDSYRHEPYRRPWMARRYFVQPRVDVYRPYRYYAYVPQTYVAPTYVPQAYAPAAFINGQSYVPLAGGGRVIELQMTNGPAFVDRVALHYADGRTQIVHVDAHLDATNPVFDLPVDGYGIIGVTLFGEGAGVSAFAVQ